MAQVRKRDPSPAVGGDQDDEKLRTPNKMSFPNDFVGNPALDPRFRGDDKLRFVCVLRNFASATWTDPDRRTGSERMRDWKGLIRKS